jgi:hypothetical protein
MRVGRQDMPKALEAVASAIVQVLCSASVRALDLKPSNNSIDRLQANNAIIKVIR